MLIVWQGSHKAAAVESKNKVRPYGLYAIFQKDKEKQERGLQAMSTKISRRWKHAEDVFCSLAGMERLGHMARGLDEPDGRNDAFTAEVRTTERGLALINEKMAQAVRHNKGSRTPIVVLVQAGKRVKDGFVVYRVKDWVQLYCGKGGTSPEETED